MRVATRATRLAWFPVRRLAGRYPDFVAVELLAIQASCEPSALQGLLVLLNRMGLINIQDGDAGLACSARLTAEGLRLVGRPARRNASPQAMRRKP
jgi:hypothetical protein